MLISNNRDTRPPEPKPLDRLIVTYVQSRPRKGNIVVKRGVAKVEQPPPQVTETEIDKILREQLGIVPISTPEVVLPYHPPQVTEPEPVIEEVLTEDEKFWIKIRAKLQGVVDTLDSDKNNIMSSLSSIL